MSDIRVPLEVAAAIIVPTSGFVIWLLRLEGRVNVHGQMLEDLRDDIRYIRERIDVALDKHAGV